MGLYDVAIVVHKVGRYDSYDLLLTQVMRQVRMQNGSFFCAANGSPVMFERGCVFLHTLRD